MFETLKTGFVVTLLLAVLFGVYTVLNKPEPKVPREVAWSTKGGPEPLQIEDGSTAIGTAASMDAPPPKLPASLREAQSPPTDLTQDVASPAPPPAVESPVMLPTAMMPNEEIRETPRANTLPNSPLPVPDLTPNEPLTSPAARNSNLPKVEYAASTGNNLAADGTRLPDHNPYVSPANTLSATNTPRENSPTSYHSELGAAGRTSPIDRSVSPPPLTNDSPQIQTNPYVNRPEPTPPANRMADLSSINRDSSAPIPGHNPDSYARLSPLATAKQAAQAQINRERWRDALHALSSEYRTRTWTPAERNELHNWLDPLAAKVIYSTEHLVEVPHVIRPGENLATIASQYSVPWQLLQNINNVANPNVLLVNTPLKVVRGPFEAEVDLTTQELTLYTQGLYAGRFPVAFGNEPAPQAGTFMVQAKNAGHPYLGRDGQRLDERDPRNPFARCWIDLGREMSIHGSSDQENPAATGCIRLSPKDADDVFAILSQGSRVTVHR